MKKTQRVLRVIFILSFIISQFFGLSNVETISAKEKLKVGILQPVEHTSFNFAREGFMAGLEEAGYKDGDNLKITYLNANGDTASLQTMAESLVRDNDYLLAIGTPSIQTLANVTKDKPIFFTAVSDPKGAGVIKDLEHPGGNITGTSNLNPIASQIELMIDTVPEAKRIGIMYNAGEANSIFQVEKATEIMKEKGLEPVLETVATSNDVSQVADKLVREVDAIFLVTDNTTTSAINLIGEKAKQDKVPVFGGANDIIADNGLATYGLDYFELGKQTADMLLKSIKEEIKPGDMPVEYAKNLKLEVNRDFADAIGIDPDSIKEPKKVEVKH